MYVVEFRPQIIQRIPGEVQDGKVVSMLYETRVTAHWLQRRYSHIKPQKAKNATLWKTLEGADQMEMSSLYLVNCERSER